MKRALLLLVIACAFVWGTALFDVRGDDAVASAAAAPPNETMGASAATAALDQQPRRVEGSRPTIAPQPASEDVAQPAVAVTDGAPVTHAQPASAAPRPAS